MSLDVSLIASKPVKRRGTGVFIRDGGQTRELSPKEVAARFDGAKVAKQEYTTDEVYADNITHNLTKMADKAGIYYALWRPEEIQCRKARDLIVLLQRGIKKLHDNPEGFKALNPDNGWGSYEGLVGFVERYLAACKKYPDAEIEVSR